MSDDHFLARWSRRKLASAAGPVRPTADAIPEPSGIQSPKPAETQSTPTAGPERPTAGVVPGQAGTQSLPPVESLTPESDFTAFMQSDVDPATRRSALKTLFQDPRFNVMDGLDVYIDDYSKPDPLPEGWLEKMNQFARLGDFRQQETENVPAAGGSAKSPQLAEKSEGEQPVVETPEANSSDTPDAGPPPAKLRES